MLLTKFQAPEANGFEEEDFFVFSMYFFGSNPGARPFWNLRLHLNKLSKGPLGNVS